MYAGFSSLWRVFVMALGLAFVLAIGLPQAQGEIFVQIGDIEGSYPDYPYEDYSQVEGYGVSITIDASTPQFSPMTITKQLDLASVYILEAALDGFDDITNANIYLDLSGSGEADKWTVYWQLGNISVTSYSTMAGSNPSFAGEKFTLDYRTIHYEYQEINDEGNVVGSASYDYDRDEEVGGMSISGSLQHFQFVTQSGIPVPEPATLTLLLSALMGLGMVYLRQRGMKS